MRALVFRAGRGLAVEDLPEPQPGPDDVLIAPSYVQVCLTDVLNAEQWPPRWPTVGDDGRRRQHGGRWGFAWSDGMVPGHEGGGEVLAVGRDVTGLAVGDRVLVDATFRHPPGPIYLGVNSPDPERFGRGLMAELCAVPASMAYRCPESVPPLGVVGGEIGGATVASVRCSGQQLGDNVVQIGGQLFGGYRMQLARLAGADHIVYVEADPVRRRWAETRGLADSIVDPTDGNPAAAVRELLPHGADVVHASNVAAGSWALAARIVRPGGAVVPFDSDPRLADVHLEGADTASLVANGVRWLGHAPGIGGSDERKGGKARNDHQIFVDLMAQGRIDGGAAVTRTASLTDDLDMIGALFTTPWRDEVRTALCVRAG